MIDYIAAQAEALGITQAEVHRSLLQEGIDARADRLAFNAWAKGAGFYPSSGC